MRLATIIVVILALFACDASAQLGRTGSCGRCDSWTYDGEGGLVTEPLANGRMQTIRWCDACYRGYLAKQKADKIPEATAEDYAESERYWHNQKLKLHRLSKVDGGEALAPRKPAKSERKTSTPAERPKRITIMYKHGLIIIYDF